MNIPPNEEKLVKLAKQYSDLLIDPENKGNETCCGNNEFR